jgi:hypothetical protein
VPMSFGTKKHRKREGNSHRFSHSLKVRSCSCTSL